MTVHTATSPSMVKSPDEGDATASRTTSRSRARAVAGVAESFVYLQRTARRAKARLLAAASNDVESATQLLLRTVAGEGPMRASMLAASVQSDLSTVSRQVSALVGRGLLERRADPLDGRASLLGITEAGRAVIAVHEQDRVAFFDEMLSGWSDEQLRKFTEQLSRFTAAYDQTHTAWMTNRAARTEQPSETYQAT
jgi:DNA-binding MarR family transcriptional regulator